MVLFSTLCFIWTALQEFHSQCKPPGFAFLFFLEFFNLVICSVSGAKAGLVEQRSILGGKRKGMATANQVRQCGRTTEVLFAVVERKFMGHSSMGVESGQHCTRQTKGLFICINGRGPEVTLLCYLVKDGCLTGRVVGKAET